MDHILLRELGQASTGEKIFFRVAAGTMTDGKHMIAGKVEEFGCILLVVGDDPEGQVSKTIRFTRSDGIRRPLDIGQQPFVSRSWDS